MLKERWKDVVGYEGLYQVSDVGRVKRIAFGPGTFVGKILQYCFNKDGYPLVNLHKNSIQKQWQVHRLVLQAFIGSCPIGMECCHNDGDKHNIQLENLRWDTHSNNISDAVRHETLVDNRGSQNGQSKLTEKDVVKIKKLGKQNVSFKLIAEIFNISLTTIYDIIKRRTWRHIND